MHTEQEAIKLWCPHDRHEQDAQCIGSRCSQWRWIPALMEMDMTKGKPERAPKFGPWKRVPTGGWISEETPTQGFCGLAGKP